MTDYADGLEEEEDQSLKLAMGMKY